MGFGHAPWHACSRPRACPPAAPAALLLLPLLLRLLLPCCPCPCPCGACVMGVSPTTRHACGRPPHPALLLRLHDTRNPTPSVSLLLVLRLQLYALARCCTCCGCCPGPAAASARTMGTALPPGALGLRSPPVPCHCCYCCNWPAMRRHATSLGVAWGGRRHCHQDRAVRAAVLQDRTHGRPQAPGPA